LRGAICDRRDPRRVRRLRPAYDARIAAQDSPERRADVARLDRLIRDTLPDLEVHESDGGIGYGPFHYRYASGREGDTYRVSLANRKTGISLYVLALTEDGRYLAEARADRFPKANVGKACVRFKRLDDLDEAALRELLVDAGRLPAPGAVP
jgi:hypothetical protein